VISSPGDSIGFQRRVDEIANRLRFQFDMQECRHAPNTVPLIIFHLAFSQAICSEK
jgi:hypothetical protein